MFAQIIPAKRSLVKLPFFDYAVPPELADKIQIGQLVKIPLRQREEFGIVKKIVEMAENVERIKNIKEIVTERPLLSSAQLNFLKELSVLYNVSLGFLAKSNLPPLQKRKLAKIGELKLETFNVTNTPSKPTLFTYQNLKIKTNWLQKNISKAGQTLILVPEIYNLEQWQTVLPGEETAIINSNLSDKQIFDLWLKILSGKKRIIVGTRRALFLPWFNLQTIILDDEASPEHKCWDMAPRTHNRDACLLLAKHHGAKLYLLAHQPSVESYFFATKKTYDGNSPFFSFPPQNLHFVNLSEERQGGNYELFGESLLNTLKETASSTFIYCHRRGAYGYLSCKDCGEVNSCTNCQQPLTYHQTTRDSVCHHCQQKQVPQVHCKKCDGMNIKMSAAGTETIAQALKKHLPDAKIIVIDKDQTTPDIDWKKKQIIVGTSFAWKFIQPNKIKLFAFVNPDAPLFIPEYKTTENLWHDFYHAFSLLPVDCQIFIQTNHYEHAFYQNLTNSENFYKYELQQRQLFGYPPFRYILKLIDSDPSAVELKTRISQIYQNLLKLTKDDKDIKILPPSQMFPAFYQGKYWQTIIIKLAYSNYKKNTKQIVSGISDSIKVDPNPNTILSHS